MMMRKMSLSLANVGTLCIVLMEYAFSFQQVRIYRHPALVRLRATTRETVDRLLQAVEEEPKDEATISSCLKVLEESTQEDDSPSRFQKLVGLYDVAYTKVAVKGDNPVGGKWTRKNSLAQKLLTTRRTFQHILATNSTGLTLPSRPNVVGEAVNVISLDALFGLVRCTVILRGDATALSKEQRQWDQVVQPLSSLAVRAWFDPPRIIFGKTGRFFNLNLGRKSSVLLDTLFVDDKVRIGMGGRTGTRFVFVRTSEDDAEANEFRNLLARKPLKKSKALSVLMAVGAFGVYGGIVNRGMRLAGFSLATLAGLLASAVAFSSGGIERDRSRYEFFEENNRTNTDS